MPVLVSVIVPVYNVESYLSKCVESIKDQSYTNIEIVLVDDGSTDSSGNLCDEFAKSDGRIKVFHKVNGGVSSARNLGIDVCHGEYITFIDSDDWVEQNYIEVLLNEIQTDANQLVFCKYDIFANGNFKPGYLKIDGEFTKNTYDFKKTAHGRVWGAICSRKMIGELRFDENLAIGEDALFFAEVILKTPFVKIISDVLYHYVERDGSALLANFNEGKVTELYAWKQIASLYPAESIGNKSAKARLCSVGLSLVVKYSNDKVFKYKYYRLALETFKSNYKFNIEYCNLGERVKIWLARYFSRLYICIHSLLKG